MHRKWTASSSRFERRLVWTGERCRRVVGSANETSELGVASETFSSRSSVEEKRHGKISSREVLALAKRVRVEWTSVPVGSPVSPVRRGVRASGWGVENGWSSWFPPIRKGVSVLDGVRRCVVPTASDQGLRKQDAHKEGILDPEERSFLC